MIELPLKSYFHLGLLIMKLIVNIKVGTLTQQEISLPVGKGTQTIKWLAYAAAHRIVQDGIRHGGRQLTSKRRDRYTFPRNTRLMPKDVYTDDCPFLHPYDIIKDHLTDGQSVNVDLYESIELDEYGIPVLSPRGHSLPFDMTNVTKRNESISLRKRSSKLSRSARRGRLRP